MKIAFFDTKEYDRSAFSEVKPEDMEFKFFETRLTPDSVELAKGSDAVCVFVNDEVSEPVIDRLYELGAVYAAMSGSGSSLFGLFREPVSLDEFSDPGTFKGCYLL